MRGTGHVPHTRGAELLNLQRGYAVRAVSLLAFARSLGRRLRLGSRHFNVCLVDDNAIQRLNSAYRGKNRATDVLSFPWAETEGSRHQLRTSRRGKGVGITNFLGDIAISVETARRNAFAEGHSTLNEIRWLILHGVLHLLGYDHERDGGEMVALELALREDLGVAGGARRNSKAKVKTHTALGKAGNA